MGALQNQMDTNNGDSHTSVAQVLPSGRTTKEFKSSNAKNQEIMEAQLNELRKEFYQKDETIDDILRKRGTINDRKIF